jgi:hypothetical protein
VSKRYVLLVIVSLFAAKSIFGQIDSVVVRTDSLNYYVTQNNTLKIYLTVENISAQDLEFTGLTNPLHDTMMSVFPEIEMQFSQDGKNYHESKCGFDIDPIAGWDRKSYSAKKIILASGIIPECLYKPGYLKVRFLLSYGINGTNVTSVAKSNWFTVIVKKE